MEECFRANIFLTYFPAHTTHGMQPANNGVFKVLKGAYRKYLAELNSLSDSSPVGKINFIRCFLKARKAVTPYTIKSAFRHPGIYPINRLKCLKHPEIQPDKPVVSKAEGEAVGAAGGQPNPDLPAQPSEPPPAPTLTRRFLLNIAKEQDEARRRRQLKIAADEVDSLRAELSIAKRKAADLEEKERQRLEEKTSRRK